MIRALARTMAALSIAATLAGCGSTATAPHTEDGSVTATSDLQFTPGTTHVTLASGSNATVTWVFESVTHNVRWDAQPEGAAVEDIGNTSSASIARTFHVAGTYSYHCAIHSSMTGTVVVE